MGEGNHDGGQHYRDGAAVSRIQEFDFSVDVLAPLLWQYNEAANLESLLTQKQVWYTQHQTQFWADWYRDVFDLRTANDFGLSVWAILLGVPLEVSLAPSLGKPTFGFGVNNKNFGRGNFSSRSTGLAGLTREQKRLVLRLRYYQLVSRGTVPEINRFLNSLFGYRQAYVLDGGNMELVYVFTFVPDSQLQFVLEQYDLLPRPAGVGVRYIVSTRQVFGFGETNQNFGNGTFA